MNNMKLQELLEKVRDGSCDIAEAMLTLKHMPGESLGFACIDHHRRLRTGLPEVVYGEGKTADQIISIMEKMMVHSQVAMATRVDTEKAAVVCNALSGVKYYPEARIIVGNEQEIPEDAGRGVIAVISAGTSDVPVAEEVAITAWCMGNRVERLYDVGVAGIHRLLAGRELLERAVVIVVVAGMEGALPSVVGGLVDKPVIAVPTSIGYGTSFGGIAALLGMLNSCAPGVAVVNIDNGFGAACVAAAINRKGAE
ncbi:MAG: nickel pincer cofactor biosynthesis protein LarB [Proteobacteria bacterium]|nr:nickel pincer cofactor biosynthesis protein LarB [Pseudomonadota bacterium]MBU1739630.1 nickel pincer cofactor biosynthesis protein LarB [Pseudomonadota bacterium]